jgi:potassium efflux system protein
MVYRLVMASGAKCKESNLTMFEILLQQIGRRLEGWSFLPQLLDVNQLMMLVLILGLAWALQPFLHRTLKVTDQRLIEIPWTRKLIAVIKQIMLPVTARILVQLTVEIFRNAGLSSSLLELATRLITLWFIYKLLAALFTVNLSQAQAKFWAKRVLLPVIAVIALLRLFGLLDQIQSWGFSLGQGELRITVGSIFFGVATLTLFFILSRGIRQFLQQVFLPQAGAEPALTQAISALVSYTIVVLGAAAALSAIGIDLTTFAVIIGGLSVGLGFGLQEVVNNFISGFILLFERSLGPGDVIKISDETGEVQSVGIRSTAIRTRADIELIVPNSYFLTEMVTNLTRTERQVRVRISVGVSYNSNPREVEKVLLEAAVDHPHVLSEPAPRVQFKDFGDSSLNFDLLVWTNQVHRIPGFSSELRFSIWDGLAAHNIEIPFPQRDIHIRS